MSIQMHRLAMHRLSIFTIFIAVSWATLTPALSWACACGCGIFDVGTSSMFPTSAGGMVFFEYDYLDQTQNHFQSSQAPASANQDKEIDTHFFRLGGQFMFSRNWGTQVEIPAAHRLFSTTDNYGNPATLQPQFVG